MPHPGGAWADHGAGGQHHDREVASDPSGPMLLHVTKTLTDSHAGKLSLCKVLSGTLTPDTVLVNTRTRDEERLHALQALTGHTATATSTVIAGDFVAIPRLNGDRGRVTRWPPRDSRSR